MNRRTACSVSAGAIAASLLPNSALAQSKTLREQLIGSWILVSWEQTRPDGTTSRDFGTAPKGINMFDADGNFSLLNMSADIPKIAAANRVNVTAQEAMSIVAGSVAYYGTYSVDEASKTLLLNIDGTTFANQYGAVQKRLITAIGADEMRYRVLAALTGNRIDVVWRRAR